MNENDTRLIYRPCVDQPVNHATAFVDQWWCFHPERGAVFYRIHPKSKYVSPQCNQSREVAESIRSRLYPWAELKLIHVAFLKTDERGYL